MQHLTTMLQQPDQLNGKAQLQKPAFWKACHQYQRTAHHSAFVLLSADQPLWRASKTVALVCQLLLNG
ncbi:hypothetical protein KFE26_15685 [Shewanella sp. M16]|uniref:hypothetical protein n=1 Tax=Shewanella sp. M16 TaxID=2830837 RepID=UPI001BAF28C5|nr:hypothetical protein [Shewanella sp. M16]MBS0043723.1 hypothetical protein [Shewanella sp. M16]